MTFVPAGNPYILAQWGDHPLQRPLLQGLHCVYSAGSTLGPFIVSAFLLPLQQNYDNSTLGLTFNGSSIDNSTADSDTFLYWSTEGNIADLSLIKYAYISVGSLSMVAGVIFCAIFITEGCKWTLDLENNVQDSNHNPSDSTEQKVFRVKMIVLMLLFYCLYISCEGNMGKFISIFVIKYLDWEEHHGALLMSAFWAVIGTGRLVGVPLSTVLKPKTMLIVNLSGIVLSFVLMLFVDRHVAFVWTSVLLSGYSMSTTFATGFLWVSNYIRINGMAASIFFLGPCTSNMASPPFIGYMFQTFSPIWLVYFCLTCSVLNSAAFAGTEIYARYTSKILQSKELTNAQEMKPLKSRRLSQTSRHIVNPIQRAINIQTRRPSSAHC